MKIKHVKMDNCVAREMNGKQQQKTYCEND